jgi:hypothetical protein
MSPRKILQDIVPPPKIPLKDKLPVHTSRYPHRHVHPGISFTAEPTTEKKSFISPVGMADIPQSRPVILERSPASKRSYRKHPFLLIATLVICAVAIVITVSFVYAKAVVTIVSKKDVIAVNSTFTACKDAPCAVPSSQNAAVGLSYEVIQIPPAELHQVTPAVDGPLLQANATGSIVLYNNYTTTAQTIIAGTRVSNTAGLIYKTLKTVVIPGFKKIDSTPIPGSVPVSIIAVAPGAQYNILPTDLTGDFKIVAYKGTAKYDDFYGRLNPNNAVSGGFSGPTKIVASSTLASTYVALKQKLAGQLLAESHALIPAGYILFDNASSVSYTQLTPTATSTGLTAGTASTGTGSLSFMDVGVRATFYGVMFKETDLAKTAAFAATPAEDLAVGYPNDSFSVSGLDSATFTPTSAVTSANQTITFTLKASLAITGIFPVADILKQLEGKTLAQSNAIFANYSTIASAHAIITPFWRHSFPASPDKIDIIIQ